MLSPRHAYFPSLHNNEYSYNLTYICLRRPSTRHFPLALSILHVRMSEKVCLLPRHLKRDPTWRPRIPTDIRLNLNILIVGHESGRKLSALRSRCGVFQWFAMLSAEVDGRLGGNDTRLDTTAQRLVIFLAFI